MPIINCGTSFYAGFVIFSVLGFMATKKHTTVASVVADGKNTYIVYKKTRNVRRRIYLIINIKGKTLENPNFSLIIHPLSLYVLTLPV